ncbi:MAG: hypothetical protein H7A37_10405 [Chlamydiales bacterium]|nr:hypothetical protein [Chlamydiia bacterium]MCP5508688.1 hypothetical protein [Chlamydiales bacterium]
MKEESQIISEISDEILFPFTQFLMDNLGLYFPTKGWTAFRKKLPPIAKAFGFSHRVHECLCWLMETPLTAEKIEVLTHQLTVGETYFFRDKRTMELLNSQILPRLIEKRRGKEQEIRIWSAACCTGEEPYSIAMMLHQLIPDIDDWKITIIGTDINADFLRRAQQGTFREWSFRSVSPTMKTRYFKEVGIKTYQLSPEIRKLVKFRYLNLADNNYPSIVSGINNFDIVLCNNVLIYFSYSTIDHVIDRLTASLADSGNLIVTAIEAPYVTQKNLTPLQYSGTTIFQKTELATADVVHAPIPVPETLPDSIIVTLPEFLNPTVPTIVFNMNTIAEEVPAVDSINEEEKEQPSAPLSNEEQEAQQWYRSGNYEQVINRLESKQNHLNTLLNILLIRSLANVGDTAKAREICENALAKDKLEPELYYLHAILLDALDFTAEAVRALKNAIFLNSEYVIAYFTLGNLLIKMGNPSEAQRNFRNAAMILKEYDDVQVIAGSDGMTANELASIINQSEAS